MSRLARALWIEIESAYPFYPWLYSRGSREPCGLKYNTAAPRPTTNTSRLARALWIEIQSHAHGQRHDHGRGSREPCGLKFQTDEALEDIVGRGSREPCGLKFLGQAVQNSLGKGRGSREPCGLKYTDG